MITNIDLKTGLDERNFSFNKNEFLFYSNNPEPIKDDCLADNGKWLCREEVEGYGQIYTWHVNNMDKNITSTILIYNPNNFKIKVKAGVFGKTNKSGEYTDREAWHDYFTQNFSYEEEMEPNSYTNFFRRVNEIKPNNCFGVVSRLSITDLNGNPAKAVLFDLVYVDEAKSGNATMCAVAETEGSRSRGLGKGFYGVFNLPQLLVDNNAPCYALGNKDKFGTMPDRNDSFNGKDLVQIIDSSGQVTDNNLYGNYGVQMDVNLSMKNIGEAGNFAVFVGTCNEYPGCGCYPFICYNGIFYDTNGLVKAGEYVDILNIGYVEAGGERSIEFFTANTAGSCAPLVVGFRRI